MALPGSVVRSDSPSAISSSSLFVSVPKVPSTTTTKARTVPSIEVTSPTTAVPSSPKAAHPPSSPKAAQVLSSPKTGQSIVQPPSSPKVGQPLSSPKAAQPPSSPKAAQPPSSPKAGLNPSSPKAAQPPSSPKAAQPPSSPKGGLPPSSPKAAQPPSSPKAAQPPSSPKGGLSPSSPKAAQPPSSPKGGQFPLSPNAQTASPPEEARSPRNTVIAEPHRNAPLVVDVDHSLGQNYLLDIETSPLMSPQSPQSPSWTPPRLLKKPLPQRPDRGPRQDTILAWQRPTSPPLSPAPTPKMFGQNKEIPKEPIERQKAFVFPEATPAHFLRLQPIPGMDRSPPFVPKAPKPVFDRKLAYRPPVGYSVKPPGYYVRGEEESEEEESDEESVSTPAPVKVEKRVVVRTKDNPSNVWNSSLWDFREGAGTFLISCICPCGLFGYNQRLMQQSCLHGSATYCLAIMFGLCCGAGCVGCKSRAKLRHHFGLPGHFLTDFFSHACCPCLAMTQEHLQLVKHPWRGGPNSVELVTGGPRPMNFMK